VHERGVAPTVDLAYLPVTCNHCDDAPCVKAGRGAVTKRADGIVIIDPDKARGRKDLVDSCPYGAIWWNDEHQLPQAWIFDAHLLDRGWAQPRCVQACGTGAIEALKVEDHAMADRARTDGLEVLRPELGTRPRVYYRNLHRAQRVFVAGTVVTATGGTRDAVAGAIVTLHREGREVGSAAADVFGEFRIDRLPPGLGTCTLTFSAPGFETATQPVQIGDAACSVGTLEMHRPSG
jgi:Fe-S-cluster-containing dehydrogenase component